MQALSDKPVVNVPAPAGTLIISSGSIAVTLVILQKGQASIRYLSPTEPEQITDSRYFYSLQAPAILGASALVGNGVYSSYIVSEADSVISCYATSRDHLLKIFASKPNIAVLFLRSLLKEVSELQGRIKIAQETKAHLANLVNGCALGFTALTPELFSANELAFQDEIVLQARETVQAFQESGGVIPSPLSVAFLNAGHASLLGEQVDEDAQQVTDTDFELVRRLVSLPPELLAAMAQRDPAIFMLAGEKMAGRYDQLFSQMVQLQEACADIARVCFEGDGSWVERLALQTDMFEQKISSADVRDIRALVEFFRHGAEEARKRYFRLWGVDAPAPAEESWGKIVRFASKPMKEARPAVETSEAAPATGSSRDLTEIKDAARKIIMWSGLGEEKYKAYVELYGKLKKLHNPLDPDDESRKIRRQMNNMFWDIYEAVLLKHLRTKEKLPLVAELFLNLGYLEEDLLDEEHLVFLLDAARQNKMPYTKYPIHTAVEWFTLIYEKKVPTSIDELGLTFFETLRQDPDNKNKGWRRESDLPPDLNSGEARVKHELRKVFITQTKLTSGQIMSFLNPLNRYMITQNIHNALVTKAKLGENIDKLLNVDFSAFHREVLFTDEKHGINREFIQVEVIPNFILTPIAGTQFQFWQDREGNDRMSRGRLVCPILAFADLYSILLIATARYRWESLKTQLGPDWNNISVSSLTADYTDYVQFLHKNKELSPEMKEKVATELKRHREDWQRFAHDYSVYLKYESEGTQRLNKVIRRILTKHIPFRKEIRERLIKLPAYADVVMKSTNIRRRKAAELRPRYQKYERDIGRLPDELAYTLKFYNMEF